MNRMHNSLEQLFDKIVYDDSPYEKFLETSHSLPPTEKPAFHAYVLEKINIGELNDRAKNRYSAPPIEDWHYDGTHPDDENADLIAIQRSREEWPRYIDSESNKILKFLQPTVNEVIAPVTTILHTSSKKFTYSAYAKALELKGITITKTGIGVINKVDYVKKFGLNSAATLYNKLNELEHKKISDSKELIAAAQEIIDKYNL